MRGDRLVIGQLLVDSLIINLGKNVSTSRSEECDSDRSCLGFLFEFEICIICFFAGPVLHHPS